MADSVPPLPRPGWERPRAAGCLWETHRGRWLPWEMATRGETLGVQLPGHSSFESPCLNSSCVSQKPRARRGHCSLPPPGDPGPEGPAVPVRSGGLLTTQLFLQFWSLGVQVPGPSRGPPARGQPTVSAHSAWEDPLPHGHCLLTVTSEVEGEGALWGPFGGDTTPPLRTPPYDLLTPKGPPHTSTLGIGFSAHEVGRHTYSVHKLLRPVSP